MTDFWLGLLVGFLLSAGIVCGVVFWVAAQFTFDEVTEGME